MDKKNLIAAGAALAVILVGLMIVLLIPKKYTVTFDTAGGSVMEEVEVKKGTTIGYIAQPTKYYSTEGTNLYFEMKKDGEPIDPIAYLP